jgi:hypothetical protein
MEIRHEVDKRGQGKVEELRGKVDCEHLSAGPVVG